MIKKYDMGRILLGNTLTDREEAGVVVDRIVIRVCVYMVASHIVLMSHLFLLASLLD